MVCIKIRYCLESQVFSALEAGRNEIATGNSHRCLHHAQQAGGVRGSLRSAICGIVRGAIGGSVRGAIRGTSGGPVRGTVVISVLFLLLGLPVAAQATSSDLLIALESDGLSFLAQHTIASNGPLVSVDLPDGATLLETRFMGPEKLTFAHAQTQNPGSLTLWSGSAFARYQHRYGDAVRQNASGEFQLASRSVPESVIADESGLTESSITWLFPDSLEIVSFSSTEPQTGFWKPRVNTLTFYQTGDHPVTLSITYRARQTADEKLENRCKAGIASDDDCAADVDEDGIPDHRDICLDSENADVGVLGCDDDDSVTLQDILFTSGQSYLDVNARRVLDRVARALQQDSSKLFEVGAHTDNGGGAGRNRKLSQQRADAVRYYLMLRGVGPNQVYAAGYGETYPIQDNGGAGGRRANRRVELTRVQ